jgi:hypothetical protein
VSAEVAEKQHAEIVNTIDLIGSLPPGLYEMIIEDKRPEDVGVDLLPGNYLVRFEERTVQDILALDDGREDEAAFETAARISDVLRKVLNPEKRSPHAAHGLTELAPEWRASTGSSARSDW